MPAIANYYAQVGINVDTSGAVKVQRYLDGIKRQMTSFQRSVSRSTEIPLRVTIDTRRSMAGINRELRAIAGTANITIRNLNFSRTEAVRSLNRALSGTQGRANLRIGALLSQESLRGMREQLRSSINSLTISPTIRPNVRQAVQRGSSSGGGGGGGSRPDGGKMLDPRNTSRMSPWHNPMMIGGGMGAFLRYGAFSLPFVAGAFGLNALTHSGERVQNAYLGVRAQVGNDTLAKSQLDFLTTLGYNHGIRLTDMAPGYSQMFAAAQGSELQDFMQQGFQNFIQYASVAGLNEEQKKGAILALSQIVGKGGRGFAQELNLQLTNQGMPNARRMFAEAVAGGDMAKFEQMMQKGEVGLEGVRKFLELLGAKAQPYLPEYYDTITAQKGRMGFANEQFLKTFLDSGGTKGLADFFATFSQIIREATPYAEKIGAAFERASYAASSILLIPGELSAWVRGLSGDDNIFQHYFGTVDQHKEITELLAEVDRFLANVKSADYSGLVSMKSTLTEIKGILTIINNLLGIMSGSMETYKAFKEGGMEGVIQKELKDTDRSSVQADLAKAGITPDSPEYSSALFHGMTERQRARERSFIPDWLRWMDNSAISVGQDVWSASKAAGSWMWRNMSGGFAPLAGSNGLDIGNYLPGAGLNAPPQSVPSVGGYSAPTEINLNVTVSGEIGVEPNEAFSSTFGASVKDHTYQSLEEIIRGVAKNHVPSTPH